MFFCSDEFYLKAEIPLPSESYYEGYPQMQKAMQEMVLNRLTSVQRIGVANDRIGDQDVVTTVLQADMEKLRETAESVERASFQAAVKAILGAKHIYVLG